jgi:hypothetical protein
VLRPAVPHHIAYVPSQLAQSASRGASVQNIALMQLGGRRCRRAPTTTQLQSGPNDLLAFSSWGR